MRAARYGLPPIEAMSSKLAIAIVAASVVARLAGPAAEALVLLVPDLTVGKLYLWQPLSYILIERQVFGVLFGALIVWSIGGQLEMAWGTRRFLRFALATPAIAGVLTVLAGLFWPRVASYAYGGGTVMTTALWVAYGLNIGRTQTNFWGFPLTGNALAGLGIGFVLLNAAFARSLAPVLPNVFAIGMAALYVRQGGARSLWGELQRQRWKRKAKARANHLRVIDKDRNTPTDSDRYLH